MTHTYVCKLTIIGSDNGLSPGRRQAIIWSNAAMLLIWTLGTNFSEFLSKIHAFAFKKMHLKISSAKWCPFLFVLLRIILETSGALWILVSCDQISLEWVWASYSCLVVWLSANDYITTLSIITLASCTFIGVCERDFPKIFIYWPYLCQGHFNYVCIHIYMRAALLVAFHDDGYRQPFCCGTK